MVFTSGQEAKNAKTTQEWQTPKQKQPLGLFELDISIHLWTHSKLLCLTYKAKKGKSNVMVHNREDGRHLDRGFC